MFHSHLFLHSYEDQFGSFLLYYTLCSTTISNVSVFSYLFCSLHFLRSVFLRFYRIIFPLVSYIILYVFFLCVVFWNFLFGFSLFRSLSHSQSLLITFCLFYSERSMLQNLRKLKQHSRWVFTLNLTDFQNQYKQM